MPTFPHSVVPLLPPRGHTQTVSTCGLCFYVTCLLFPPALDSNSLRTGPCFKILVCSMVTYMPLILNKYLLIMCLQFFGISVFSLPKIWMRSFMNTMNL